MWLVTIRSELAEFGHITFGRDWSHIVMVGRVRSRYMGVQMVKIRHTLGPVPGATPGFKAAGGV